MCFIGPKKGKYPHIDEARLFYYRVVCKRTAVTPQATRPMGGAPSDPCAWMKEVLEQEAGRTHSCIWRTNRVCC